MSVCSSCMIEHHALPVLAKRLEGEKVARWIKPRAVKSQTKKSKNNLAATNHSEIKHVHSHWMNLSRTQILPCKHVELTVVPPHSSNALSSSSLIHLGWMSGSLKSSTSSLSPRPSCTVSMFSYSPLPLAAQSFHQVGLTPILNSSPSLLLHLTYTAPATHILINNIPNTIQIQTHPLGPASSPHILLILSYTTRGTIISALLPGCGYTLTIPNHAVLV